MVHLLPNLKFLTDTGNNNFWRTDLIANLSIIKSVEIDYNISHSDAIIMRLSRCSSLCRLRIVVFYADFWWNGEYWKRKFGGLEFCYENNFLGKNRGELFRKHLFGHLLLQVITTIEAFCIRKHNLKAISYFCKWNKILLKEITFNCYNGSSSHRA